MLPEFSVVAVANGLRWTLLVLTVLVAVGWVALLIFADGFRRSFGASENAGWKWVIPLIALAALIFSLALPEQRTLLHNVAVLAVLLAAGCGWLARQSVALSLAGFVYLGLWFAYYWQVK